MKKFMTISILVLGFVVLQGQTEKPYILASVETGGLSEVVSNIETKIEAEGFEIVGKYSPMKDKNSIVVSVTHQLLKDSVNRIGGLTAFASVLRFGFYKNGEKVDVTYTNPVYWGNAYYRNDFPQVEKNYKILTGKIRKISRSLDGYKGKPYGSKKGLKIKKLRKYKYMIGMPKFHSVVKIKKESNYEEVLKKLRNNLSRNMGGAVPVYEIAYPQKKLTLFGVGLHGQNGEKNFLPKIDISEPKHLTFLPYELLVMEDQVVMLHGRFRIALSFPDLTMGTFMKIMSTPKDIANTMRLLTIVK